jgi:hypothetical protein
MIEYFLHRPWVVADLRASVFGADLDTMTEEFRSLRGALRNEVEPRRFPVSDSPRRMRTIRQADVSFRPISRRGGEAESRSCLARIWRSKRPEGGLT